MTSSARRALHILEIVNSADEPMGVTAIANAVGTFPGTAFRSLDALERREFVSRYLASTFYQVGTAAIRLKQTLYAQFPLRTLANPFMRRLAFATNCSVSLTVSVGWFGLRLIVVAGSHAVRSGAAIGLTGPLDATSAGRVILAGFGPATTARFLAEVSAPDGKDRDPQLLSAILKDIATGDFALEAVEASDRLAVALPVRYRGRIIAAVTIDGPLVEPGQEPDPHELASWRAIVSELEYAIEQTPNFSESPFNHLDPGTVTRAIVATTDVPETAAAAAEE